MIAADPTIVRPLPIAGELFSEAELAEIRSPYDDELVGRIPIAGIAEVDRAVAASADAYQAFARWPRFRRAAMLEDVARGLENEKRTFAELISRESAKPIAYSTAEVERAATTFRLASALVTSERGELLGLDVAPATVGYSALVERRPIGVVAAIAPFNFPLNLVAHKLAPAFAVGNGVVLKPPPQAPLSALALADLLYGCGLPRPLLSVVHCEIPAAERLATHPSVAMLSFTGSSGVGWHLKRVASDKRVVLELGGNAAAIVPADADVAWAAKRCAVGAFAQAGQVCIKVQRLFVDRALRESFTEAFLHEVAHLPVGDPLDPKTVVGPVIDERNAERIEAWIAEAVAEGARVLAGGSRNGRFVQPTVLIETRRDMRVECEEVFGPVVTLSFVNDVDEAIARANDSPYGLQAGIFSRDVRTIRTAFEALDVGALVANDYPTLRADNYPYGGVKRSGSGREGVRYAMNDMSELRTLVMKWT